MVSLVYGAANFVPLTGIRLEKVSNDSFERVSSRCLPATHKRRRRDLTGN